MVSNIRVCLNGNQILTCPGETIGIYTVAPSVLDNGSRKAFTAAAYSVRFAETGMTIAAFLEQHIALNFASMLLRRYGDISQTLRNSFHNCETDEDAALLNEIHKVSFHKCRVRKGMLVPYVAISGLHIPTPTDASDGLRWSHLPAF